jgi:hypothetical protein
MSLIWRKFRCLCGIDHGMGMELEAERNAVSVRDLDALFKPTSQTWGMQSKTYRAGRHGGDSYADRYF